MAHSSFLHRYKRAIPNALTTLRLLLIIPFVFFLLHGETTKAAIIYILALITDIDGTVARKLKATSKFGAIYDPAVDAVFMAIGLIILITRGAVALLPVAAYFVSALFRLVPSLVHLRKTRAVQSTILSKTVAFSGFFAVLFGTLGFAQWITSSLLVCGTIANVILTIYWMRSQTFTLA